MTNEQLAICIRLYRYLLAGVILSMQEETPGTSFEVLGIKSIHWPEFKRLWEIVEEMDDDIETLEGE